MAAFAAEGFLDPGSQAEGGNPSAVVRSWQVDPDTYITAWRSQQGILRPADAQEVGPAQAGRTWQVPADTYINAWRQQQRLAGTAGVERSWQVAGDAYITAFRARQGLEALQGAPSASASASTPGNVVEARDWIANWRSKQGRV